MRTRLLPFIAAIALVAPVSGDAATAQHLENAGVVADVGADTISLSNGIVERVWSAGALRTVRAGRIGAAFDQAHDDFSIELDGAHVPSGTLPVQSVAARAVADGVAIDWTLGAPAGVSIVRTVEAYQSIAGFKSQTTLASVAPVAFSGYTLDEVATSQIEGAPRAAAHATAHAFRAGADWRGDDWNPPSIGDPHTGDWRVDADLSAGGQAPGEWLTVEAGSARVSMVSERRDLASSVVRYATTGVASAAVDLSRDVIYIGPFEETGHIENPGPGPARHRAIAEPLTLEPTFTMFPADADDEGWQFAKYLTGHRNSSYRKRAMFNSDGVDANAISTGAKDDMNYDRFLQILPKVREMGLDTFIFDDGWMARSGDWCPDSPQCPEPRWDGSPTSKFRPRFPDDRFAAVRDKLAGDPNDPSDDIDLGLWMNPMEFNPSSTAFQTNPQWACAPVGDGLAAYNAVQPDSSSNEAGLGVWNPVAWGVDPDTGEPEQLITHIEKRINRAIEVYGAHYFKFDFLAWTDCGGAYPVDMYGYHDSFVSMLDRVQAKHPDVTFSIDETNDYRMFPFESTARGPAWFQNGGPTNDLLLHNEWQMSPYVPAYSIGQRSFANAEQRTTGVDTAMAASLLGHLTFSMPVDTNLTAEVRAEARKWIDFYHANSDTLAGMTYPLLDDPFEKDWTALQVWNGDTASGWLLAFRQSGTDVSRSIPLRGLDLAGDSTGFRLTAMDPATGTATDLGTFTAASLRAGLPVSITATNGYAIVKIERA